MTYGAHLAESGVGHSFDKLLMDDELLRLEDESPIVVSWGATGYTVNKIARRARLGEFSIGQPYWFSLKQIMFIPTCSSDFSNFSFRAVRGPDSDTGHKALMPGVTSNLIYPPTNSSIIYNFSKTV